MRGRANAGEEGSHQKADERVHGLGAVGATKNDAGVSRYAQRGDQSATGQVVADTSRRREAAVRRGVGETASFAHEAVSRLQVSPAEKRDEKTRETGLGDLRGSDDGGIDVQLRKERSGAVYGRHTMQPGFRGRMQRH